MFVLFVFLVGFVVVLLFLDFVSAHFPSSCFNGRIQIACRGRSGYGFLPAVTADYSSILSSLNELYYSPTSDYYVTANSFSGVHRCFDDLFSLHNIVIDIDSHGHSVGNLDVLDWVSWRFMHDFDDFDLPVPTSIVVTGRGIQLWWAIKGVSVKLKPFYDEVLNFFIQKIQEFLCSSSLLGLGFLFEVDLSASRNAIGYFRLPFTMNTLVGRRVTFDTNGTLYDLFELYSTFCKDGKRTGALSASNFNPGEGVRSVEILNPNCPPEKFDLILRKDTWVSSENYTGRDHLSLIERRLKAFYALRDLRDLPKGQEERNNFCFMVYNVLVSVYGHNMAFEQLLKFNQGFYEPMSERELNIVIITSKKKGGYLYSTAKICEFLGITEAEAQKIGLSSSLDGALQGKVKKKAISLAKKNARNEDILSLYDKGQTNAKIAKELGISVPTVSKVVLASRRSQKDMREEAVLQYLKGGKTHGEIAKLCDCSTKTVQRILLASKKKQL